MARFQHVQEEVGRRIRTLRESLQPPEFRLDKQRQYKKMTREDLASATKLSPNYLGSLELGRQNPTLETLLSIADALGVSIVGILQDANESDEKQRAIADFRMYLDRYTPEEIRYAFQIAKVTLEKKPR